ncbi:penicillin-binding protein 2 [Nocardioides sp. cx-173]|uniref:peptidoglycan D,D-transpeptidase FtsI family protein n=1 Tax=Nocardioides sp. cx-173 TaxID=2898796 RepID=UPI001E56586F|nr:penicillin-binding protein 2 [Nocardioides sp. cx-173]MCD4526337.1 penicillin-binding protein 2 [Nocardioides sp. cx-173]UGB43512.1 penicillin-binding protein 2 [Nocardioides sp. cx-173]
MTSPRPQRLRSRGSSEFRMRVGFVVIAMVLSFFGARLVQLQGLDPDQYAEMAAADGTVRVILPAERGDILDRNGEPLANSADGLMVVADPAVTAGLAPELAKFLSTRLAVDYFSTLERLRVEDSRFQYIARQVPARIASDVLDEAKRRAAAAKEDAEQAKEDGDREALEEYEAIADAYGGLATRRDPVRVYPGRDIAANLVGFLGTPNPDGTAKPSAGFEAMFNGFLAGKDGEARYQVGAGHKIPLGDNTVTEAVDGHDLRTTIDRDLQWYTQRVLHQTRLSSGGESAIAVVMDSRTGDVLALADDPTYDASEPLQADEDDFKSRAMSDVYEPGSVQKVLTMGALIDAGKVTARTKLKVPGVLRRQDRPIGDWFDHGLIKLTLAGVVAKSSNIGTVLAADRFQDGQLRDYLTRFGIGERTDIGVGGETAGLLPDGSMWTSQTEDRIAFGQSLSVNAVQMAAAVNTIANGGVRVDPSLVKGSASTELGTEVGTDHTTTRRVISEDAAHQTMLMMERVLDPEEGVAPSAAVPGYRVAGKTGTAQRVDPECKCYRGTTVSFAGFAPADDPRFTVYVVVQNPKTGGGGSVGGPAFAKLMSFALRRYAVPPTGSEPSRLPVTWR